MVGQVTAGMNCCVKMVEEKWTNEFFMQEEVFEIDQSWTILLLFYGASEGNGEKTKQKKITVNFLVGMRKHCMHAHRNFKKALYVHLRLSARFP